MRIWDISPGYLNRQSLLGEHRELHGIVVIHTRKKKGYARHPETLRWKGYGWALRQRHRLLAAEMVLRGYQDRSPVRTRARNGEWPSTYIDEPYRQYRLLASKYKDGESGRIPLPVNAQVLWRQHKYSVLARDVGLYKSIGRQLARMKPSDDFTTLANSLTEVMKQRPSTGGLRNALQHMWGHVRTNKASGSNADAWSLHKLLRQIQQHAMAAGEPYLLQSTALGELRVWLP